MKIIEAKELIRTYVTEDREVEVLKGLNFTVEEREFVGIMGRSGSGKTTLLRTLGLIDEMTGGELIMWGKEAGELSEQEAADMRRTKIGMIFQDYFLMETLTVRENIILPMALNGRNTEEMQENVEKYADVFGISALLDKYPHAISGGEKQRTAICRALMNSPGLLLADEPTGNLDSKSSNTVIQVLEEINEQFGKTILMVTHDPIVASHCKKVLFLKDGNIINTIERQESIEKFYDDILVNIAKL